MSEKKTLYPMTFEPLLKEVIWGGYDICPFKGLPKTDKKIGESWEISHVDGNYSVVNNGPLKGKDIDQLIKTYGEEIVGKSILKRFGQRFPLLIKFIDARDDLSIQVHPNDTLAKERHNSFGKTEMWYVIKASDNARLYSGFKIQSSKEDYLHRIQENTIMEALAQYDVRPGDVFFLPAGRVHAIGAGCFVAEIQQTSNITYRIYDYNRKDKDGNTRELHTMQAKDAINFEVLPDYRTQYNRKKNEVVELVDCKYFETNLLEISQEIDRDWCTLDSFVIYICMEGEAEIIDDKGQSVLLQQGHSALIPAITNKIKLKPLSSEVKLLETYVPNEE